MLSERLGLSRRLEFPALPERNIRMPVSPDETKSTGTVHVSANESADIAMLSHEQVTHTEPETAATASAGATLAASVHNALAQRLNTIEHILSGRAADTFAKLHRSETSTFSPTEMPTITTLRVPLLDTLVRGTTYHASANLCRRLDDLARSAGTHIPDEPCGWRLTDASLPAPSGYCGFEKPIQLIYPDNTGRTLSLIALMWTTHKRGVSARPNAMELRLQSTPVYARLRQDILVTGLFADNDSLYGTPGMVIDIPFGHSHQNFLESVRYTMYGPEFTLPSLEEQLVTVFYTLMSHLASGMFEERSLNADVPTSHPLRQHLALLKVDCRFPKSLDWFGLCETREDVDVLDREVIALDLKATG
ncbi:MAG: hypothetical protein ABI670_11790 [Chloroflexota bacterium]